MNRDEVMALLELTMRIAEETLLHVNFEFTAMGEGSCLYMYVINQSSQIEKRFSRYFYYDRPGENNDLAQAKEYLTSLLKEHGRCTA